MGPQGLKLWDGAVLLAELMAGPPEALTEHHPRLRGAPWAWEGARVLELGCGLALCSMVAAWLGAEAIATDGESGIVTVARQNGAINCPQAPPGGATAPGGQLGGAGGSGRGGQEGLLPGGGSFRAAVLRWGEAGGLARAGLGAAPGGQLDRPLDVVCLSDVVYGSDPAVYDSLVATLAAVCGPGTLVLQAETPRREGVLYGAYWEALAGAGFAWAPLAAGGAVARRLGLAGGPAAHVIWRA